MNILVLVAGTNEPSNSNMLADAFIEGMQQGGDVTVEKRRLKDLQIDHFSLEHYNPEFRHEEDFRNLQHLIEKADGLVIASPVWNFGVPAHLKNFIDRMGSFALDETRSRGTLRGKPFYLIFTGGVPAPAWKGLMRKTTSFVPEGLKYFGASYIGHHFESKCVKGRGKFGLVVNERPETLASLRRQGHTFAGVVKKYEETGKAPLKQRTCSRIMRCGETLLKKIS
ncbi:hypothetical protein COU79_01710 [Candidatus Peregrinibacteria bacterium CG10_big_fil_rev_8_21_14_0_10_54_7]|nr:MAG: hypothetical protein COU79_01710 [Candidatus Peregrinibacteria bacterium CG10_big_fil_rev_8_21_14_0_10_54_7]